MVLRASVLILCFLIISISVVILIMTPVALSVGRSLRYIFLSQEVTAPQQWVFHAGHWTVLDCLGGTEG